MYLNEKPGRMSSVRIGRGRGRGTVHSKIPSDKCLCYRPHCLVLCNVCGFWTKGRVRYFCPIHPQVCFIITTILLNTIQNNGYSLFAI